MGIKWRKDWPWVLFALLVVVLVQIVLRSTDLDEGWRNPVGKFVSFAIVGGILIAVRGLPEPPAKGTGDWRTNPASARRRLEILEKGRWSAWVLGVMAVVFVVTGAANGTLLDPRLIGLIVVCLLLLVGRWVVAHRLRRAIEDPPAVD